MGIVVTYGGDPIPKSPFNIDVAYPLDMSKVMVNGLENRTEVGKDQQFTINTKGAGGQGNVDVKISSPSQKPVPCVVEPVSSKDACVVKYIPKEEGLYTVDVMYDQNPVVGSPFTVDAALPPDPSK
eukprot:g32678.t1